MTIFFSALVRVHAGWWLAGGMLLCMGLAGCADYRPGRDGSRPILPQNQSSNSEPEAAGSRPR